MFLRYFSRTSLLVSALWSSSPSLSVRSVASAWAEPGRPFLSTKRRLSSGLLPVRFRGCGANNNNLMLSSSALAVAFSDETYRKGTSAASFASTDSCPLSPQQQAALTTDASSAVLKKEFGGLAYLDYHCPNNTNATDASSLFRVIFVLGGPGAGKGSQCNFITEEYPAIHLSVGQLLRDEQARSDSPYQQLLQETLVAGKIVPVAISLQLLQRAMAEAAACDSFFLVDGFPRNLDNLQGWCDATMASMQANSNVLILSSVLVYHCPLAVLKERILERSKESGRADDNLSSLVKRFATYETETLPVIRMLQTLSSSSSSWSEWNVEEIAGDRPIDQVWSDTQVILNGLIQHDVLSANAQLVQALTDANLSVYQALSSCHDDGSMQREGQITDITNANVQVMSGRLVAVTYECKVDGVCVHERRHWSHQQGKGWRNIHFSRIPLEEES